MAQEGQTEKAKAIHTRRLMKELAASEQLIAEGFQIQAAGNEQIDVTITRSMLRHPSEFPEFVSFRIKVVEDFPFAPPEVYCLTKFCFPNIADGRDLLSDLILDDWSPSMTFVVLIRKLPSFVESIRETAERDGPDLVLVGNFRGTVSLEDYLKD
eukprot:Platyproteum_vivax@DN11178_c0_g1_i1.p1